tara:strand:- start:45 stop:428 length:384 start_codon:yes stop_codon:yes gene_type:complete
MEYGIYIISSGLTAIMGGVGLNYINKPTLNKEIIGDNNEPIIYNMLDERLTETIVSSRDKKSLGVTFNDKCIKLIKICEEECGVYCNNKGKKNRQKLLRYINEYDRLGHDAFISNHKKKLFKNKLSF